jgi:hypothetical protein
MKWLSLSSLRAGKRAAAELERARVLDAPIVDAARSLAELGMREFGRGIREISRPPAASGTVRHELAFITCDQAAELDRFIPRRTYLSNNVAEQLDRLGVPQSLHAPSLELARRVRKAVHGDASEGAPAPPSCEIGAALYVPGGPVEPLEVNSLHKAIGRIPSMLRASIARGIEYKPLEDR